MAGRRLRILQVNTHDVHGGAAKIGWDLFRALRARGHACHLAVGEKVSDDPDVLPIVNAWSGAWPRFWRRANAVVRALARRRVPGAWRLLPHVERVAPHGCFRRWLDDRRGLEDFHFPGSRRLLELPPGPPDVVHCHNLHGGYFDLRALPRLSRRVPVVLSLHDAWLLTGHCSHSFECERWRTGCGACPDLTIYPALRRDATAFNWRRKRGLYARSRLHVATACRWLMGRVERSPLAAGVAEARVIPSGIDLTVFRPGDRQAARAALGVPPDARVLLFVGYNVRGNPAKDYPTLRAALERLGARWHGPRVLFLARGEAAPPERAGPVELRFVPFGEDLNAVARFYQAADVYLHPARVDTFPNVVLEALACGTPVVATAVGGIPEQVKGLRGGAGGGCDAGEATGILVGPRDADELARGIERLLADDALRRRLGDNAARDARARFDLRRQVDDYLAWYEELAERHPPRAGGSDAHRR
jgi:glycosyltransferase involved in cell wall biosynthesis